jgi:hypothetical protein
MSRLINPRSLVATGVAAVVLVGSAGVALAVSASVSISMATTTPTPSAAAKDTTAAAQQQQRLAEIKSKGDAEISRRLTQLGNLNGLITSATRITASDRTALSAQVSSETSGLTSLKTQLDGETTVAAAITDAKSIFSDYRVYALIMPKIHLIKVADDQQVNEANLTALATKLQSRLTAAQSKGKNVTTLQTTLADLNAKVKAAQAISSSIEASVIGLQPSDYNSNHAVLSGDAAQLKTAHSDNQAAYDDAKTIVQGIKSL